MSIGQIITILVIVWWIVSAIIGAVAKKQQQEQLAALARKKQQQQSGVQQVSGEQTRTASPASKTPRPGASPGASRGISRLDELRSRREQQLAELRQRRSARSTQVHSPSARQQQSPVQPSTRFIPPHPEPQDKPPPKPKQPVQQKISSPLPRMKSSIATGGSSIEQRKLVSHIAHTGVAARGESINVHRPVQGAVQSQASDIRALLSNPQSLRQMYLIKEILDPPLALRE